jgi:hypothetical protein
MLKLGLFTLRPSGKMWARAHFAPNLQLPCAVLCQWLHITHCGAASANLCKIFARRGVERGIGGVKEWARRSGLAGTLSEKFARNMLRICRNCQPQLDMGLSVVSVLCLAGLGGLLATSKDWDPGIMLPFRGRGPYGCAVDPCGIGMLVFPSMLYPFRDLSPGGARWMRLDGVAVEVVVGRCIELARVSPHRRMGIADEE